MMTATLTTTPAEQRQQGHPIFEETKSKFETMVNLGFDFDDIRQSFVKDQLLMLVFYYLEKSQNTEGGHFAESSAILDAEFAEL